MKIKVNLAKLLALIMLGAFSFVASGCGFTPVTVAAKQGKKEKKGDDGEGKKDKKDGKGKKGGGKKEKDDQNDAGAQVGADTSTTPEA